MTQQMTSDSQRRKAQEAPGLRPRFSLAAAVQWQEYCDDHQLATGVGGLDPLTGGLRLGALWVVTGSRSFRSPLLQQIAGTAASGGELTSLLAPLENAADTRVACVTRAAGINPAALHQTGNPSLLRQLHRTDDSGNLSIAGADADPGTFLAATLHTGALPRLLIIDDVDLVSGAVLEATADDDVRSGQNDLQRCLRRFARRFSVTVIVGMDPVTAERGHERWADAADVVCSVQRDPEQAGRSQGRVRVTPSGQDGPLHFDPVSGGYQRFDRTTHTNPPSKA